MYQVLFYVGMKVFYVTVESFEEACEVVAFLTPYLDNLCGEDDYLERVNLYRKEKDGSYSMWQDEETGMNDLFAYIEYKEEVLEDEEYVTNNDIIMYHHHS